MDLDQLMWETEDPVVFLRCCGARLSGVHGIMKRGDVDIRQPFTVDPELVAQLEEAQQARANLDKMTAAQKQQARDDAHQKSLKAWERRQKGFRARYKRYLDWRQVFEAWQPPMGSHETLKNIAMSRLDALLADMDMDVGKKPQPKTPRMWERARRKELTGIINDLKARVSLEEETVEYLNRWFDMIELPEQPEEV